MKQSVRLLDGGELRTCADCNDTFKLTLDSQNWFLAKELDLPRRCPSCLQKRKEAGNRWRSPGGERNVRG
ncbi:MAG: hypothetical protein E2P02_02675 [Acidobacteria bacterium]|nr:MAG: hypothetical protein E2P02_02675 [Acidobacteriota bacterium]